MISGEIEVKLTGFYMMGTFVVTRLTVEVKFGDDP